MDRVTLLAKHLKAMQDRNYSYEAKDEILRITAQHENIFEVGLEAIRITETTQSETEALEIIREKFGNK